MQFDDDELGGTPSSAWLMSVQQAAIRLCVSTSYLNKLRVVGGGPPFIKIGARVAYDPADLTTWVAQQRRSSTSDQGHKKPSSCR
jgi:hypothetical protein